MSEDRKTLRLPIAIHMKFKRFITISAIVLLAAFLGSCNRRSELDGFWVGCEVRRPFIDWTLTVRGNQFSLVREDLREWYTGFLRLNKNCRLKKIDLEIVDTARQRSNGKISLGIYEVDGDTLTIVANAPGEHLRPLSFDEPGKSSEFYFTKKINCIDQDSTFNS